MIKAGIVDPAKVVRTALQDAGSIAALLITAEAMIADVPRKGCVAWWRQWWRRNGRLLIAARRTSRALNVRPLTAALNNNQRSAFPWPMQNTASPSSQRWESYQPSKSILLWACAVTAIATMIVGFSWGGWVTGGTSQTMAAAAGNAARGELASAICVEQFKAAPDAAARLVEFKAITDSYKKRQFVEAGGWATMPGQTSPDRLAAENCAIALAV